MGFMNMVIPGHNEIRFKHRKNNMFYSKTKHETIVRKKVSANTYQSNLIIKSIYLRREQSETSLIYLKSVTFLLSVCCCSFFIYLDSKHFNL